MEHVMQMRLFYYDRAYAPYVDLERHAGFISAPPSRKKKILKQVQNDENLHKN